MGDISEYERERLSRIQDNQKFLQSLGLGLDKKAAAGGGGIAAGGRGGTIGAAIFTEDSATTTPKKLRKKKESKKMGEDFIPRRSSRSRTSTGSQSDGQSNADALAALDEIEKNWNENKHKKKNRDTGVRVVWGRTYDPINGTTCHQCRQKTLELKVTCTNIIEDYYGNKQICNVKLDEACLTNRYGQTIEAALASGEWKCPKCLGVCNCSFCRRKKGLTPTARAAGYESVDAYLRNGPPSAKKARRSRKSTTATDPESTTASPSTPTSSSSPNPTSSPTDPNLTLLFSPPSLSSLPPRDLLISEDGTPEFSVESLLSSSESDPYTDQLLFSDASTFSASSSISHHGSLKSEGSGDAFAFPPFPPPPPGSDLNGYLNGELANDIVIDLGNTPHDMKTEVNGVSSTEKSEKDLNTPPRASPTKKVIKKENGETETNPTTTTTAPENGKEEEPYGPDEYDVDKILDMKITTNEDGKEEVFFLVLWKTFEEPSWEPKSNLFCHSLLDSFLRKRNKVNRKSLDQQSEEDSPKKVSPKRKKKESIGNGSGKRGGKRVKQEEDQEATEDPSASSSPSGPGKEKRANRGTRSSQLSDFHFF